MRLAFVLILAVVCSWAHAIDIVTMPSANQLKAGEVDLGTYYVKLDVPAQFPQHAYLNEVAVGVTKAIEIDALYIDTDGDKDSTLVSGYIKLLKETRTLPDVSIGVWNITGASTSSIPGLDEITDDASYFIATAKTVPLSKNLTGPPYARLHLCYGTGDHTLLGVERHDAFFGGIQVRLSAHYGLTAIYDGWDWITGVGYVPKKYGLSVKGGTVGSDQWWIGTSYRLKAW